jgi:hypothetical protein
VIAEIHTISGGLVGERGSIYARKAHARRVNVKEILLLERPLKALMKESLTMSFSKEDEVGISLPHNDALVVTMTVANHIHWILVGDGSLVDILYWPIFK